VNKALEKTNGFFCDSTLLAGRVRNDLVLAEGIDLIELPAYSPWLPPAERLWPLTNEVVANFSPVSWDELEEFLVYRCLQADKTARFNQRINLLLLVAENARQLNPSSCAIAKKSLFPQPQGVSASNKFLRVWGSSLLCTGTGSLTTINTIYCW